MHDLFVVHFLEAKQNRVHDDFGLVGFEFVLGFDFVIELTAFQQFDDDVEGIFRLEHLMKFHAIFLVQSPHYLYFFD